MISFPKYIAVGSRIELSELLNKKKIVKFIISNKFKIHIIHVCTINVHISYKQDAIYALMLVLHDKVTLKGILCLQKPSQQNKRSLLHSKIIRGATSR